MRAGGHQHAIALARTTATCPLCSLCRRQRHVENEPRDVLIVVEHVSGREPVSITVVSGDRESIAERNGQNSVGGEGVFAAAQVTQEVLARRRRRGSGKQRVVVWEGGRVIEDPVRVAALEVESDPPGQSEPDAREEA